MRPNKKINIGISDWKKQGWDSIDHNDARLFSLPYQIWRMPYPDETYEIVFCSHVIEHISHFKIEQAICEINRIMTKNGVLRLLTPDLRKLAKAYVENDCKMMDVYINEDGSGIKRDLGLGQAFLNFIVSAGYDNYLISSDLSHFTAGYAHVSCYDFEMLRGLLDNYGFYDIRECSIDESGIMNHKDLRKQRYDNDKNHSLIIECKKKCHVEFRYENAFFYTGPAKARRVVPSKYNPISIVLHVYAHIWNFLRYASRLLPSGARRKVKSVLNRE